MAKENISFNEPLIMWNEMKYLAVTEIETKKDKSGSKTLVKSALPEREA